MKYLENNICDFEILFNYTNIKKNIISLSFFKMHNGGYKDFNLYINGFFKLHDYVLKEKKYNFIIRLFIDNSIKNDKKLFDKIYNLERVEIIIYKCKKYLQPDDNNYHLGIFGMFVRFFPLFDFKNNDANIVMILDMDDPEFFSENLEKLQDIKKKEEFYIFYMSNISRNIKHNFNYLYKDKIITYFVSPRLINFKRLPNLLTNYFNNITNYKYNTLSCYEYKFYYSKKKNKDEVFLYGIDEFFLNNNIIKYLIDNRLPYVQFIKFDILTLTYYFIKNFSFKKDKLKFINYIFDYIFDKLNIKKDNQNNLFKKLKSIEQLSKDKIILVYYNFYKIFIYNYDNKNYKFIFPYDLYKMIQIYDLFGVYSFSAYLYHYKNNTYHFDFIEKKKFDNKLIFKLKNFSKKFCKLFI
jgi:hypothetical protein